MAVLCSAFSDPTHSTDWLLIKLYADYSTFLSHLLTMTKISKIYDLWYQCWVIYILAIMERKKWFTGDADLKVNDVVYFKIDDSALGATWHVSKVDLVNIGKDGKVREVNIAYEVMTEDEPG